MFDEDDEDMTRRRVVSTAIVRRLASACASRDMRMDFVHIKDVGLAKLGHACTPCAALSAVRRRVVRSCECMYTYIYACSSCFICMTCRFMSFVFSCHVFSSCMS
jgi:hypothetical protein